MKALNALVVAVCTAASVVCNAGQSAGYVDRLMAREDGLKYFVVVDGVRSNKRKLRDQ
ncbi:hypothetical protein R0381_002950 [Jeongeupia wiesaeckerbachi]|uniref:hypothetical protein n=1 Tax=Jeongeupia wiesaeckerbachi TaxID=3051218 RepID=UPI003D802915